MDLIHFILCGTDLRLGELLALKWSKVDFERTIIVINDFTYKWLMEQKRRTEQIEIESEYVISANSGSPQNYAFAVSGASLGEDKYSFIFRYLWFGKTACAACRTRIATSSKEGGSNDY